MKITLLASYSFARIQRNIQSAVVVESTTQYWVDIENAVNIGRLQTEKITGDETDESVLVAHSMRAPVILYDAIDAYYLLLYLHMPGNQVNELFTTIQ